MFVFICYDHYCHSLSIKCFIWFGNVSLGDLRTAYRKPTYTFKGWALCVRDRKIKV